MKSEDKRLKKEIGKIIDFADGIDLAEDEEFGPDFRGDELPEELQNRAEPRSVRQSRPSRSNRPRRTLPRCAGKDARRS
ncbi:MAG: hypothetical protein ACI8QZ_001468 [Chlamydiales bacterium]|jgi:hypothetical protein